MVGKPALTLRLSLHLVSPPPSCIALADIRAIFGTINRIWSRAGIAFILEELDSAQLSIWPDMDKFLATYQGTTDGTIHGYYGHWDDPPNQAINGVSSARHRVYWIRDHHSSVVASPSLPRVSSHEIGHILGLDHYRDPKGYLMIAGGPGYAFTSSEIVTANEAARAILA